MSHGLYLHNDWDVTTGTVSRELAQPHAVVLVHSLAVPATSAGHLADAVAAEHGLLADERWGGADMSGTSESVDIRTVWDAARVGGPRPPEYGHMPCSAQDPRGFGCTRQRGHTGQHVATTTTSVVAVWPGDAP